MSDEIPFPIIGIGIGIGPSAGGLEAGREMLAEADPAPGMAFVPVQHLDPDHESMMAEPIDRRASPPVTRIEGGETIGRDHLCVIPPGHPPRVDDGRLDLVPFSEPRGPRRPIDESLVSPAEDKGARVPVREVEGSSEPGAQTADVAVDPCPDGTFPIVLSEVGAFRAEAADDTVDVAEADDRLRDLEDRLRHTRHRPCETVQELDAANEELTSMNEELQWGACGFGPDGVEHMTGANVDVTAERRGPEHRSGFGSRLVDHSARQLGAEVGIEWHGDGIELTLTMGGPRASVAAPAHAPTSPPSPPPRPSPQDGPAARTVAS